MWTTPRATATTRRTHVPASVPPSRYSTNPTCLTGIVTHDTDTMMYDVQEKWQDGEYRAKVARSSRSAEVRLYLAPI